jgi:hypothetical protein
VEADGGVDVLCDRIGRRAADRAQRPGAHEGVRAAPEGGVPSVLAGLKQAVEQGLLMERLAVGDAAAVLEAVDVVEVLWRLHQGDLRIREVAERGAQEFGGGDVIGVEDGQDLGVDDAKRMVQVSGLRVLVGRPRQVPGAERGSQCRDLGSLAIVEDPRLVRRLERDRRGDGGHQNLRTLVVGRDQDRHAGHTSEGAASRAYVDIPEAEGKEREPHGGVHLEDEHRHRQIPGIYVDGARGAPGEVRGRREQREDGHGAHRKEAPSGVGRRKVPAVAGGAGHRAEDTIRGTIGP